MKRALGSLRRLLRRGRAPRPGESEWLRLILLMRRLQHGQMAIVRKLDAVDSLASIARSARVEFAELNGDLTAVREAATELESGLVERARQLAALPDAVSERADIDRRVASLDGLVARVETLASERNADRPPPPELVAMIERLDGLADRLDSAKAELSLGAQEELAKLYERIQELAEGMAASSAESQHDAATPESFAVLIESLQVQLDRFETQVQAFTIAPPADLQLGLDRLERVAARLERRSRATVGGSSGPVSPSVESVLAHFAAIAERMEQGRYEMPEAAADVAPESPVAEGEVEELRANLLAERDARRQGEEEVRAMREKLRSSELARVELETRHAAELTQMADHVQLQIRRLEDDLKKKKRGMSELTEQNIALQERLAHLTSVELPSVEDPPSALPSPKKPARARKKANDAETEESRREPEPETGREE